jgi:hypothetical protein
MVMVLNSPDEGITISEEERLAIWAKTTGDEWVTFQEMIANRRERFGSLRIGERCALEIAKEATHSIHEDRRSATEIEMIIHWRNCFLRAMMIVIDHYDNPRSADELHEAAIDLAYIGFCIGYHIKSPDKLVTGKNT